MQTASSSLFNIGSHQTKCFKTFNVQAVPLPPSPNPLRLAKLFWIDSRTVLLRCHDGSESRYRIQVQLLLLHPDQSRWNSLLADATCSCQFLEIRTVGGKSDFSARDVGCLCTCWNFFDNLELNLKQKFVSLTDLIQNFDEQRHILCM